MMFRYPIRWTKNKVGYLRNSRIKPNYSRLLKIPRFGFSCSEMNVCRVVKWMKLKYFPIGGVYLNCKQSCLVDTYHITLLILWQLLFCFLFHCKYQEWRVTYFYGKSISIKWVNCSNTETHRYMHTFRLCELSKL